jgi:hypothetical protein
LSDLLKRNFLDIWLQTERKKSYMRNKLRKYFLFTSRKIKEFYLLRISKLKNTRKNLIQSDLCELIKMKHIEASKYFPIISFKMFIEVLKIHFFYLFVLQSKFVWFLRFNNKSFCSSQANIINERDSQKQQTNRRRTN